MTKSDDFRSAAKTERIDKGIVKTATACECEKTLKIRQKQHKKRNIILKSALRVALLELLPFTTLRER